VDEDLSTSDHRAPITSLVRQAVKTKSEHPDRHEGVTHAIELYSAANAGRNSGSVVEF
jgi:hypothetical protein